MYTLPSPGHWTAVLSPIAVNGEAGSASHPIVHATGDGDGVGDGAGAGGAGGVGDKGGGAGAVALVGCRGAAAMAGVMVTATVAEKPPACAVIIAEPALTAVTPPWVAVATPGADE